MAESLAERVRQLDWYHTLDLPGGVVTKGFFDIRPVLDRYGLPKRLDGKRVLDVGTFDGFFAFEFERRGAEVVGLDVPDEASLDWPAPLRRTALPRTDHHRGTFDVAKEALGSRVVREFVSVYDATPERLGQFDLVFVGSVLIHLRDPVGALMALHRVCRGEITIVEEVDRRLDLLSRWAGLARFQGTSPHMTWWVPNRRCWSEMLVAAGFGAVRHGATFVIPFNGRRGGVRHAVLRASPTE
jgi:tRNA (mo5U34)-methyltransferase